MNLREVIKKRRSARSYLPRPIPDEVIKEMIEAARLAPSGGNGQNWLFGLIKDAETKTELARAAGNQLWIATAPVVIACCARLDTDLKDLPEDDFGLIVNKTRFGQAFIDYMNCYPDRKMVNTFWNNCNPMIPGEHIFLTATNYGLSACWIGYLDIGKVSDILGLPSDIVCLFLMPVGYAKGEPQPVYRKAYEEIVFYEKWNNQCK